MVPPSPSNLSSRPSSTALSFPSLSPPSLPNVVEAAHALPDDLFVRENRGPVKPFSAPGGKEKEEGEEEETKDAHRREKGRGARMREGEEGLSLPKNSESLCAMGFQCAMV